MVKQKQLQSILKEQWIFNKGFSLVEVLLSSALFALIVFALVSALIYGLESVQVSGSHSKAALLAEEGLEAVRNIRDNSYSNLSNGTYGLAISAGKWNFSGSSDSTDSFTRTITITTPNTDRFQVSSTVVWQETPQRNGSVALISYLTNWKKIVSAASCNDYAIEQGYSAGTCRQNAAQCSRNGETYLPDGDAYCTGGPSADTCCAAP